MKIFYITLILNILITNVFSQDIYFGQEKGDVASVLKRENRQISEDTDILMVKDYTIFNYQFKIASYFFKENKLATILLSDYYEKKEFKNKERDYYNLSYLLKQNYTMLNYQTKFLDYDKLFVFRHTFDKYYGLILSIGYNEDLKLYETKLRVENAIYSKTAIE